MDWLIGVLLLVVGVVIGFFVAKYVYADRKDTAKTFQKEQTLRDIMAQQSQAHIDETRNIARQFEQYSQALSHKLDAYEKLLNSQNSGVQSTSLSYFGEHASPFLQREDKKAPRVKNTADVQPLDFSDKGSGLFSGTDAKHNKTKAE